MEVVKQIKTPTGKLCRREKALSHVLVGKGSEVFPLHLVTHQLHWMCGCFCTWTRESQEKGT